MKVAVVGAGIGGLAAAFALQRRGVEVVVFEASDRPGGVIGTVERDGFLLETAANGFLNREPAMMELVDALGLRDRLRPADPSARFRFVYSRGALRAVPSSPPAFLKSDVVPFGAKLRMAGEVFSSRGTSGDESLGSFARRHIGARATSILIDAVQTGIFAGDVERLSVHATFPRMVELERQHRSLVLAMIREGKALKAAAREREAKGLTGVLTTFDGGMQTLIDALASAIGPSLRLGTRIRGLSREGARWRVVTMSAGIATEESVTVDHLVLATPAPVTSELLGALAPEVAGEIGSIPYAPIAAVHVGFRSLPNPPVGFGFLVPSEENRRILGALYVSSFFPHRAPPGATLLTVMVGGANHPERAGLDDAALQALVLEELADLLGVTQPPDLFHVVRWPRGIPQYEVGHLARIAQIEEALRALPGLHLAGNPYRGVSVLDNVKNAAALTL